MQRTDYVILIKGIVLKNINKISRVLDGDSLDLHYFLIEQIVWHQRFALHPVFICVNRKSY
jgi:hypothetical protein